LSYAGLPYLFTIPIFILSIRSAIRVIKTHKHLERSRCREIDSNTMQHLQYPTKDNSEFISRPGTGESSPPTEFPVFGLTLSSQKSVKSICVHIQNPLVLDEHAQSPDIETASIVSSSLPTFAPPAITPYAADYSGEECPTPYEADLPMDKTASIHSPTSFRLQNVQRSPFPRELFFSRFDREFD
jgi:hypothetical protein